LTRGDAIPFTEHEGGAVPHFVAFVHLFQQNACLRLLHALTDLFQNAIERKEKSARKRATCEHVNQVFSSGGVSETRARCTEQATV
jgi:hypothetical protein